MGHVGIKSIMTRCAYAYVDLAAITWSMEISRGSKSPCGKEKRKSWSEMVDKRISADWKSMSAAGVQVDIRHSMAISSRNSAVFSFGAVRPPSMVADPSFSDTSQIRRPGAGLRNVPSFTQLIPRQYQYLSFHPFTVPKNRSRQAMSTSSILARGRRLVSARYRMEMTTMTTLCLLSPVSIYPHSSCI